jgi:Putative serine esterase (DUF676)
MWGKPDHLAALAEKIRDQASTNAVTDLHLLVAQTNVQGFTYDGVDHGGERVADEVHQLSFP